MLFHVTQQRFKHNTFQIERKMLLKGGDFLKNQIIYFDPVNASILSREACSEGKSSPSPASI